MKNPFRLFPASRLFSLRTYIRQSGEPFVAPFYHAVSDTPLPHISHLYRIKTAREFEEDLDTLLRTYEPVSIDRLPEVARSGKPCFLLSFDDGLRSFYDTAAPILRRKGVPCICFLNSDFIGNRKLFYRFKQSLLIDRLKSLPKDRTRFLPTPAQILAVPYTDTALLDRWAVRMEVDFEAYLKTERPYMDEKEIRLLAGQGFRFGGHSIDHPRYHALPLEEQLHQTAESCRTVCRLTGETRSFFSFPFSDDGVETAFFRKAALDFSFGTAGLKHDSAPRHCQRIPMEQGSLSAQALLKDEYAYFLLKRLFGKNRIER